MVKKASKSKPRKKPGRPKDLDKQAAILQAAKQHFTKAGFDRASMDAIAALAGVSKLTVYGHFGSKDRLFKAVVVHECSKVRLTDDMSGLLHLTPKEALTQIGRRFLDLIFQQEVVDMHRVVIGESAEKPKISQLLYEAGPEKVKGRFRAFLSELHRRKLLRIPDLDAATSHFFILLKGERHYLCLCNLAGLPNKKEKEAHLTDCIGIFLKAYAY